MNISAPSQSGQDDILPDVFKSNFSTMIIPVFLIAFFVSVLSPLAWAQAGAPPSAGAISYDLKKVEVKNPEIFGITNAKGPNSPFNLYFYAIPAESFGKGYVLALFEYKEPGRIKAVIYKKTGKKYKVVFVHEYEGSVFAKPPEMVRLSSGQPHYLLLSYVFGMKYGQSIILSMDGGKVKAAPMEKISAFPISLKDLNRDGIAEILALQQTGNRGGNAVYSYIEDIYHYNGKSFENISADYPEFYQDYIREIRSLIAKHSDTPEFVANCLDGIIYAKKILNSPDMKLTPVETVIKYYQLLKNKDYIGAYLFTSEQWKEKIPFPQFSKASIPSRYTMEVAPEKPVEMPDGSVEIKTYIVYRNTDGSVAEESERTFRLIKENGIWKLNPPM